MFSICWLKVENKVWKSSIYTSETDQAKMSSKLLFIA